MSIAKNIRDFIDTLFPHRTVLLLRRELAEQSMQYADHLSAVYREHDNAIAGLAEGYKAQLDLQVQRLNDLQESHAAHILELHAQSYATGDQLEHAREDLKEARTERDYFRNRCERLELRIFGGEVRSGKRRPNNMQPVAGGARWQQVVADHLKTEAAKEAERQKAKEDGLREQSTPAGEDEPEGAQSEEPGRHEGTAPS